MKSTNLEWTSTGSAESSACGFSSDENLNACSKLTFLWFLDLASTASPAMTHSTSTIASICATASKDSDPLITANRLDVARAITDMMMQAKSNMNTSMMRSWWSTSFSMPAPGFLGTVLKNQSSSNTLPAVAPPTMHVSTFCVSKEDKTALSRLQATLLKVYKHTEVQEPLVTRISNLYLPVLEDRSWVLNVAGLSS
eukprot:CAMPEP_0197678328 /NCGR_PEP_ID=MMETSP1338-20131121/89842_1 /TAXON_ID=43686 ORGANISM="Pelagodinium beii, Strain RCC1491" /NCGR_SAMPLE_ID=MMETSP1338 /ASSEMBLY_ACC=CAM_ASM_000754 /LENGTH=196 /DNA_ID=CAMNT_0043259257 /DNA_START=327 /DNA_END=914 /DNA_ORIENTATION=-